MAKFTWGSAKTTEGIGFKMWRIINQMSPQMMANSLGVQQKQMKVMDSKCGRIFIKMSPQVVAFFTWGSAKNK